MAEVNLGWNNGKLQAGARGAEAIVQGSANRMRGILNSVGEGFGAGLGMSAFATIKDSALQMAGSIAQATVTADSLRMGMSALEGSTAAANARIEEMRNLAKSPGLGFEQAVQADISLRSVGLSASLSAKTIEEMGNALALVGKGKADLDGVLLAITQIVSKGKVSAEEINQIAERVPQIRKVLTDTFGTADTEELQKMNVPVDQFIRRTVEGFSRTIPRALVGMQGQWDNMTDALTARAADFGTALYDNMQTPIGDVADAIEEDAATIVAAGSAIGYSLRLVGGIAVATGKSVMFCVDGLGQLTEDSIRLVTGIERDSAAMRKAEDAARRLADAQGEAARVARDLKQHQDEAAESAKAYAAYQLQLRDRALEVARAQQEVATKTAAAVDAARGAYLQESGGTTAKLLTDEQKLTAEKEKLLNIERDLAKVSGQKGGEEIAYKLLTEREKVMGNILELGKAIEAQNRKQAEEAAKILEQQQQELVLLDLEIAIIQAQANGQQRKADAMERTRDIAQETLNIMRATGLSEEEALKRATALVDARDKANRAGGGGDDGGRNRIMGYSRERQGDAAEAAARATERREDAYRNSQQRRDDKFGGLREYDEKQKTPLSSTFRTPGLDAFQKLQDRSRPVGAPMPAADTKAGPAQEMPTVEQLLKQLISTTEGLKEA